MLVRGAALENSVEPHERFGSAGYAQHGRPAHRMKVTFWVYLIGALALAGIAPLAGSSPKMKFWAASQHQPGYLYPAAACSLPDRLVYGAPGFAGLLRQTAQRLG